MAGHVTLYRDEVFNFLRTCTIKFSPFSYIYGEQLMLKYGYTDINMDWNPYYHNLCGEYQSYDTPMYIYSKEDGKDILFEKSLAQTRPRLFEFFKVPSKEHDLLCKKYPHQVPLIKSILYPVKDIQTCIDADELSLLAYDDSLLYEYERESILDTLREFLDYVRVRWWTTEYVFEDLYPQAFYYMLWQALPNVIFAKRMYNIGTPHVHPFHVWEYLTSKGMGDYRDVLTNKQSLWLYRNLRWVYKNQGKHNTMQVLADNILNEMAITLYGKDLVQQTKEGEVLCNTTPEITSMNVSTDVQYKDATTIEEMNLRIYDSGLDHDISSAYVDKLTDAYQKTRVNQMPTKYLEMKKNSIYTRWENLLSNFLFETTIYRYIKGQINYDINVVDPITNTLLQLPMEDALALIYYACGKLQKQTPELLPTKFSTDIVYNKEYPTHIPEEFMYLHVKYKMKKFIDIDGIMSTIHYTDEVFVNQDTFSDYLTTLFSSLLRDVRYMFMEGNDVAVRAMKNLYVKLICKQTHMLKLSDHLTYDDWFHDNKHIDYYNVITYYNENNADYSKLVDALLFSVFPITEGMANLVGSTEYLEKLYSTLRKLFVQLCSYNVVFLDTARDRNEYIIVTNMKSHCDPEYHESATLRIPQEMQIEPIPRTEDEITVYTDVNRTIAMTSEVSDTLYHKQEQLISLVQTIKSVTNFKSGMHIYLLGEQTNG